MRLSIYEAYITVIIYICMDYILYQMLLKQNSYKYAKFGT